MADWRQIQARIRKAKNSPDALAKLTQLYEKTHDAMVAFELAELLEKSGQNDAAVPWYTSAAQRFRRAEWKKRAEAALLRLGAALPAALADTATQAALPEPLAAAEIASPALPVAPPPVSAIPAPAAAVGQRRRHRGRRGGRGRGRAGRAAEHAAIPAAPATVSAPEERPEPARISAQPASRAGEPALVSRMAQLESHLRRLIASPLHSLDQAEEAPAGPGVFLLSDLDQVTHYYVEACQTLRVALGNLVRGRGGHRDSWGSLKAKLAKHLGISDSQVTKYLKQNCAVRWIQVDEGASHLAHFAVAVLRPPLND